jgi:hypothetical protein
MHQGASSEAALFRVARFLSGPPASFLACPFLVRLACRFSEGSASRQAAPLLFGLPRFSSDLPASLTGEAEDCGADQPRLDGALCLHDEGAVEPAQDAGAHFAVQRCDQGGGV